MENRVISLGATDEVVLVSEKTVFKKRFISLSFLFINIIFLIVFLGLHTSHLVYLFSLYVFTGFLSSMFLNGLNKSVISVAIVILILALGLAKYQIFSEVEVFVPILTYLSTGNTGSAVTVLGISYFVFRAIHFVVEVRTGTIRSFSWLTLFNFLFFFPSFLSGPIDRYNRYSENQNNLIFNRDSFETGVQRIIIGVIKKYGFAALFSSYSISTMSGSSIEDMAILEVWARILCCTMWLYFDFSGYCDMAIGVAKLMGINLPENFDSPFRATNIQDFWNRWHISLSTWIRDYLFFPLNKVIFKVTGSTKGSWIQAVALMLAFMLSGIWHGDGVNYLLWGLFHGIALGCLLIYRYMAKKNFKKKYKLLKNSNWYLFLGWLSTFIFVNLVTVLFFCNVDKALLIYSNVIG